MGAITHQRDFEELYRRHYRDILAYCARRLAPSEALDAAAETFIVAWRRRTRVPDGDLTLPWLYAVARRVVSNHRRSRRRHTRLNGRIAGLAQAPAPDPEQQVIDAQEQKEIVDALQTLSSGDREVLMLATWEDLRPAQIASVLGISRAAADQRLSRARRRLARKFSDSQAKSNTLARWEGQPGG